ncbi:LeuA family protein [candidate division CSSED10-310 bacterium]|uniref:LeuA family protein n=1 Tax=candidate division CSSED10-310 bacterium TaxID=2855610 RepID=A0ABV6YYM9_UNCC1
MKNNPEKITLKDATLREGLDTPTVTFSITQKLKISIRLYKAGIPEIEVVAPGQVQRDLEFVKRLKTTKLKIKTSGLVYAHQDSCEQDINDVSRYLDRFDLLMPISEKRKPHDRNAKIDRISEMVSYALDGHSDVGVGFPNATQTESSFLLRIVEQCDSLGVRRVTIYDTNGRADPFEIFDLMKKIREKCRSPIFFHGHNDLGLATANSLAAVYAGANGLDVTVNGLGDRAGNASLEQVALCLHQKGFYTGIALTKLRGLSKLVAQESGVQISKLSPVVGEYIFKHKSPGHLDNLELFEAYSPDLIGVKRKVTKR